FALLAARQAEMLRKLADEQKDDAVEQGEKLKVLNETAERETEKAKNNAAKLEVSQRSGNAVRLLQLAKQCVTQPDLARLLINKADELDPRQLDRLPPDDLIDFQKLLPNSLPRAIFWLNNKPAFQYGNILALDYHGDQVLGFSQAGDKGFLWKTGSNFP